MTREEINKDNEDKAAKLSAAEKAMAECTARANKAEAEKAEISARLDAAAKERDQFRALLVGAEKERDDVKAMLADAKARADKAEAALANPAFIDAAMKPAAVKSGTTDAEADKLDQQARADAEAAKPKNKLEAYEAMPFGDARKDFYGKNKTEILRLMEERG